ncbi:plasmid mobilization relaxosome protein MobC [Cryobacterium sp. M91]|uniref:plasmid mobilization relaxosome protein MobC n=1 Tax=Cryobacterium sp. M91 TaxID=2048294 RepID=UPI000CE3B439|nr:plasmid mobilization relaxosome protein MobC [Cryobacterium sp. M91]
MTRTDEASGATPKRPRKKAVNFAKRRTLRFSDSEERAVENVRRALAKSSGRDIADVTFSEALRLLITDKIGTAEIEAQALAMERHGVSPGANLASMSDRLGYELGPIRNFLSHISGNVNQIAKRLNKDDPVTAAEVSNALEGVAEMKAMPDEIERRIAHLVAQGLPSRRGA